MNGHDGIRVFVMSTAIMWVLMMTLLAIGADDDDDPPTGNAYD